MLRLGLRWLNSVALATLVALPAVAQTPNARITGPPRGTHSATRIALRRLRVHAVVGPLL